jgi:hypothetical protein
VRPEAANFRSMPAKSGGARKSMPKWAGGCLGLFKGNVAWVLFLVTCALSPNTSDAAPHQQMDIATSARVSGSWKDSTIAALAAAVLIQMVFTCVGKKRSMVAAEGVCACSCACAGCRMHHREPTDEVAFDAEVRAVLHTAHLSPMIVSGGCFRV